MYSRRTSNNNSNADSASRYARYAAARRERYYADGSRENASVPATRFDADPLPASQSLGMRKSASAMSSANSPSNNAVASTKVPAYTDKAENWLCKRGWLGITWAVWLVLALGLIALLLMVAFFTK